MPRSKLAIVIPVYNEEAVLPELLRRLRLACDAVADLDWHVLFVNDGSRDGTLGLLMEEQTRDRHVKVVDLSRNFGHQPAISAGLALADADAVVVMDADLQDPPEVIPDLVAAWREGAQVVVAVRRSRQERGLRRLGFDLFHRCFGWIADSPIDGQAGVFGLMDRQAVAELRRLTERNRFLPGLRAWLGFDQRRVYYDRQERAAGEPKQTFGRLVRYAADGIISFSFKPLRLMLLAGLLVSTVGFVLALVFIVKRLAGIETAETGFTTLVTLILFLGGIQLIAVGLLGEYLGRTYDEAKQRPIYIVRRCYGFDGARSSEDGSGAGG